MLHWAASEGSACDEIHLGGGKISVPPDLAPLFLIERGEDRFPNSPDYNSGLAQSAASVREFRRRFSGGRVLVVGHSGHGGQFLYALVGKRLKVDNAKEMRFRL